MKVLRSLLVIVFIATVFTGCQSYGKRYKLDSKHSVYYKGEGVDEALAKKLADYLKANQYFQDSIEATVQIVKVKDTFNLNFVVDAAKLDAETENSFLLFGGFISQHVFNKAPVTIHLTNNKLEPFKNLGYAKPTEGE